MSWIELYTLYTLSTHTHTHQKHTLKYFVKHIIYEQDTFSLYLPFTHKSQILKDTHLWNELMKMLIHTCTHTHTCWHTLAQANNRCAGILICRLKNSASFRSPRKKVDLGVGGLWVHAQQLHLSEDLVDDFIRNAWVSSYSPLLPSVLSSSLLLDGHLLCWGCLCTEKGSSH